MGFRWVCDRARKTVTLKIYNSKPLANKNDLESHFWSLAGQRATVPVIGFSARNYAQVIWFIRVRSWFDVLVSIRTRQWCVVRMKNYYDYDYYLLLLLNRSNKPRRPTRITNTSFGTTSETSITRARERRRNNGVLGLGDGGSQSTTVRSWQPPTTNHTAFACVRRTVLTVYRPRSTDPPRAEPPRPRVRDSFAPDRLGRPNGMRAKLEKSWIFCNVYNILCRCRVRTYALRYPSP